MIKDWAPGSIAKKNIISLRKTIALLIITAILLIAYVWTRLKAIELSYKYSKLSMQERSLIQKNSQLRLELASLKAPERLTKLALKKFNFIKTPSENKFYIKIKEENSK